MSRLRLTSKAISALLPALISTQIFASSIEDLISSTFTVPADYDNSVQIGMPFNLMSGDFRYYRCISAPYVEDKDNTQFDTYVYTDHRSSSSSVSGGPTNSRSDLIKTLSGDYDELRVLNDLYLADVETAMADSLVETDTSITTSYSFDFHNESDFLVYSLNDSVPGLSEKCQELINDIAEENISEGSGFIDVLGTHLVTEVGYGAKLFVHVKVSTQSPEEKELIEQYLSIATWELTEGYEEIPESILHSTSVELFVTHVGGEPSTFLENLSNSTESNAAIARCDLTTINECGDVYRTAISGFSDSLLDDDGEVDRTKLVRTFYTLKPLTAFGLNDLVVDELKSHAAVASGDLDEMLEGYNAYNLKLLQVKNTIKTARQYDNEDYLQYLYGLRSIYERGRSVFKEASRLCRKSYFNDDCALIKQELYNSSINESLNVLSITSEGFSGLIDASLPVISIGSPEKLSLDEQSVIQLNWQVSGPDYSLCEYSVVDAAGQSISEYTYETIVSSQEQTFQILESSLLADQSETDSSSQAVLSISCKNLLPEESEASSVSIRLLSMLN